MLYNPDENSYCLLLLNNLDAKVVCLLLLNNPDAKSCLPFVVEYS